MQLITIDTGFFKLDGGAMFGVVPKTIWQQTNPADDRNMCTWAMRCMLVQTENRLILIDTGIGNKQSEKFFSHYYLHGDADIDRSLRAAGFDRSDITDVFLTHLHFDHCGGAIRYNSQREGFEPAFPAAKFWSNERHWRWATEPNPREKASFLSENIQPIHQSGQLNMIARDTQLESGSPLGFDVLFVDGHTDSMMLPLIHYKGRKVVFMADLLPSAGHIPLAYVMGYDTRPLITLAEKERLLLRAVEEQWVLFFEHDPVNECCTLKMTDHGPRADQFFRLSEL
ncbi:MAG: MBL fold metallo-hydrolase [Flavobacteriales bacterium]|nr:MBL fold metallo-hydrolase [Flavobacteriales bacterium]